MTLSAHKLKLGYQNTTVIDALSLSINSGQITSLIGPNGCGKSTFLKALSGILQPQSGSVTLDNKALSDWASKKLARRLSLMPQHPVAPENISVQQLVSHGRYPHQGLFDSASVEDREAIEWAMQMTGISALRHRDFNSLSGGERQRGWLAMALAQQSDFLLLDEPTTFLDIGHQMEILDLLFALNQQHKLTIIMVLHDINQASQYSHRVLAMREGNIIADGDPVAVLSPQLLRSLFAIECEVTLRQECSRHYPYCIPLKTIKNQTRKGEE